VAAHSFHTSPSFLARPDKPTARAPPPSAADSNKDNGAAAADKGQPTETPSPTKTEAELAEPAEPAAATDSTDAADTANVETRRERLRSAGYGSARARAHRNNRVEEAPALELPDWFEYRHISLYERRPIGLPGTRLPPLPEEDRQQMLTLTAAIVDKASLSEQDVESFKEKLARFATMKDYHDYALHSLKKRVRAVQVNAFWQTLLLVYRPDADPAHIERLRQHHAESIDQRPLWWPVPGSLMSDESQRWFPNIRSDVAPGSGLHMSPLAKWPDPEYPVCVELLAAVNSQLAAPPASDRQESRRPPIVLSMLKGKGRTIANSVINDIATDLKVDVVHLDAHHIARIVGRHVGQNQYSNRGSVSMLGYAAAEMNGRLLQRPSPDSEHLGVVAVELPSRLRSLLSTRQGTTSGSFDSRWEDMRLAAALEAMVAAVDRKRDFQVRSSKRHPINPGSHASRIQIDVTEPRRDLIIHLHDYVELSSLYPSIIHKLQAIADRMWRAGRRTVLVGSSGADMDKSPHWREQLVELGRNGATVIPFEVLAAPQNVGIEKSDNGHENLTNIEEMLRAMVGDQVPITFATEFMRSKGNKINKSDHEVMFKWLTTHVLDAQWVQRLVSLMVGGVKGPRDEYDAVSLNYGMKFLVDRDKRWEKIYPSLPPPYFSPLSSPRNASSSSNDPATSNLSGAAASKEYTKEEKKLLSGLIDAKDIHTTFDNIIVPQETKESLIGLTTLSLIRPEAFSYGVLKTEHIPGCLLYGPPGTGKTLLAKAVAKESGASMLEVSAADINDKYVGQSEKSVQALFSLARKLAPCVIFLDEADALLAARRSGNVRAAHRETITQFLREWDGLTGSRAFIMVATNRPFDLDEAVLRRLPRKILVDLPLVAEREAILRVMLKEETLALAVDLPWLAKETELYSGSDLKNLCVSAAMEAVREEVRNKEAWTGEGEYVFPERRVLNMGHFEKGLREISASISGDMQSLKAIRKFDEQYGDAGRKKKVRRGMGFEVVKDEGKGASSGEARVRQVDAAA
jgi:AAA+ superfamily predicted ATPase